MNRILGISLLIIAALTGCVPVGVYTEPATYDFNPTISLQGDYDEAWSAVVEYFAIASLPIQTIEKASGIIVSSWLDATSPEDPFCDCGTGEGVFIEGWRRGKFNVFLKETTPGNVELRVTCTYQQQRTIYVPSGNHEQIAPCNSTGNLETALQEYVAAKLQNTPTPEIPVFRPGNV
jgi:hypothetical protein